MNVLEGTERRGPGDASARGFSKVSDRNGPSVLVGPGFQVSAPENAIAVGARPEHLQLGGAAESGDGLVIDGEMVVSERLGADRIAYVQTGSGLIAVRVSGKPPAAGERVTVWAPAASLSFFDAAGRLIFAR